MGKFFGYSSACAISGRQENREKFFYILTETPTVDS